MSSRIWASWPLAPVSIIYDMVEERPEEQQVTGVNGGCVSATPYNHTKPPTLLCGLLFESFPLATERGPKICGHEKRQIRRGQT